MSQECKSKDLCEKKHSANTRRAVDTDHHQPSNQHPADPQSELLM